MRRGERKMTPSKRKAGVPIYQIKVTLEGIRPPVWRRLLVQSDISLGELHDIIQAAFGWLDYHLHQFIVGDTYFGVPDPDYLGYVEMHDEEEVTLDQVAAEESAKLRYEYDFGDSWLHQVLVEKIVPPEPGQEYPVCTKGRRARPPEDVGGIWGYQYFLEAIADPEHEEHEEYLAWAGGAFDPEAFDAEEVNQALGALRHGGAHPEGGATDVVEVGGDLALINRSVAIIKPGQPMVDWINRTAPVLEPVTLEALRHDCTAILVPDFDGIEEVLEFLEPFKAELFEMELGEWTRDPADWPADRTAEMFDAWFDIEVHFMVWDLLFEAP
jgi:hypothetical protein